MRIKRAVEDSIQINITPVIDMVFLLLIFFLVATRFSDIERDIRVRPPTSRHARPITAVPEEIVINVTREGAMVVAGQERSVEDIDRLLKAAVAQNPLQAVVVRGDKDSILRFAVAVLDLCEKHDVKRTYLTTRTSGP